MTIHRLFVTYPDGVVFEEQFEEDELALLDHHMTTLFMDKAVVSYQLWKLVRSVPQGSDPIAGPQSKDCRHRQPL